MDSGASRQTNYNAQNKTGDSNNQQVNNNYHASWTTGSNQTGNTATDTMKLPGQPRKKDDESQLVAD